MTYVAVKNIMLAGQRYAAGEQVPEIPGHPLGGPLSRGELVPLASDAAAEADAPAKPSARKRPVEQS